MRGEVREAVMGLVLVVEEDVGLLRREGLWEVNRRRVSCCDWGQERSQRWIRAWQFPWGSSRGQSR